MNKKFIAIKYKHNKTQSFSVDWYLGKRCNFACSYCVDYLHDNYSNHVPFAKMEIIIDKLHELYGSNILFSLTGGEPTLNSDFIKLCKYLKATLKMQEVSLTTNGSRSTDYFLGLFKYLDHITMSLHFEYLPYRVEEYIERILELEKFRLKWNDLRKNTWDWTRGHRPKSMLIRFMMLSGQFELIDRLDKTLKKRGISNIEYRYIRPQSVEVVKSTKEKVPNKNFYRWKTIGKPTDVEHVKTAPSPKDYRGITHQTVIDREETYYSNEERKYLNDIYKKEQKKMLVGYYSTDNDIVEEDIHYNKLNREDCNNFKGWICWAGVTAIKITPDGNIFIGSCHTGGPLGNLYKLDKSFKLPTKPLTCPKWRCTDNLDLRQPKVKDRKYKYLIRDRLVKQNN